MRVVLCLIQFLYFQLANCLSIDLLNNFLKEKHLKVCIILSCEDNPSKINTLKALQHNNIWLTIYDVSRNVSSAQVRELLSFRNYPVGVVYDLGCPNSERILSEVSTESMFGLRYSWLIFADRFREGEYVLAQQNINVDSDIILATSNKDGLVGISNINIINKKIAYTKNLF